MNKSGRRYTLLQALTALQSALFLLAFLLVPVLNVSYIAITDAGGALTLFCFGAFFGICGRRLKSLQHRLGITINLAAKSFRWAET